MGTTVHRSRFRWVMLAYPALLLPLSILYNTAHRAYGIEALKGDLTPIWWLFVLLYFVADVLLVLGVILLFRMLTARDTPPKKESFWHEVSEIVPLWFLWHLVQLLFEYPVSSRLESVGLGKLETVLFVTFMVAAGASFFRWKVHEKAGES